MESQKTQEQESLFRQQRDKINQHQDQLQAGDVNKTNLTVRSNEACQLKQSSNVRKRGRPATKNKATRVWTDEETNLLIVVWAQHENLFNTKNKNYFNRDLRQKALTTIERVLDENGISATIKQVNKKITDLKNYYGAQRRAIESSKTGGTAIDDVFTSNWRFFNSLEFLSDAFTPRKTKSNVNSIEEEKSPGEYAKSPLAKSSRKLAVAQSNELPKVVHTAANAIVSKRQPRQQVEDEDDTFCDLLKQQLKQIPDCDSKDDLKISLQQMVLTCKRQTRNTRTGANQNSVCFI